MPEGITGLRPPLQFTPGEPMLTHNNGEEPRSTRQILAGYGMNPLFLNHFFDPDGTWIYSDPEFNPYDYTGDQLFKELRKRLAIPYKLGQAVLIEGHKDFNVHTWRHIKWVKTKSQQLLGEAGYLDAQTLDNAVLVAAIHDIGNMIGRQWHEEFSVQLAPNILPRLLEDTSLWDAIYSGVLHHNENNYRARNYANQPFDVRQAILAAENTPVSNAVLMADKMHIGTDRVWWTSKNKERIYNHPHSEGNLNTQTSHVGFSPDRNTFVWKLQFRPEFEDDEAASLNNAVYLNGNGKYQPHASERVRLNPDDEFSPIDPLKACRQIINIYGPQVPGGINRIVLTIDAAFQLFPGLESLEFRYVDKQGDVIFERIFTPVTTDEILEEFAMMNAPTK